eukprot:4224508-Pleurochrysis_carterae.AAC.2
MQKPPPWAGSSDAAARTLELLAGMAVAQGALHAGVVAKRSDWVHTWNERLAILSTESLTWQRVLAGEPSDERVRRALGSRLCPYRSFMHIHWCVFTAFRLLESVKT